MFAGAFLAANATQIGAPFGDSHDGRNGAVWAAGSQSLRRYGPVDSKLGARREVSPGVFQVYTDHPPLIYVETAVTELIGGHHTWATRAPAWLGSVIAIVLLWMLLGETGADPLSATAGVAVGLGCPMFAVFGTMLDSWIIGLPWALGTLLLWQRDRHLRSVPFAVLAVVTAGTIASSWLGWLAVGIVCLADLLATARGRPLSLASRTRIIVSLTAGIAVSAWIVWAAGSLGGLEDVVFARAGGGPSAPSLRTVGYVTWDFARDLWLPWQLLFAAPALALAAALRPSRQMVVVTLSVVLLWSLIFRSGLAIHSYWTYWMIIPLAVGVGASVDPLVGRLPPITRLLAAALLLSVGVIGLVTPSFARFRRELGVTAARTVIGARYPADQRTAWYFGAIPGPVDWIAYDSRRPGERLATNDAIGALARIEPRALVLVAGPWLTGTDARADPMSGCGAAKGRSYTMTTAVELVRRMSERCPLLSISGGS
ncbi:MAG: hypothetical protein NVSMB16_10740 [Acidimicrobiales bacterium]